jgi:hypothetical protein
MPASIDGICAWIVVERAYTIHRLCDRGSAPVGAAGSPPNLLAYAGSGNGQIRTGQACRLVEFMTGPTHRTDGGCPVIWLGDEAASLTRECECLLLPLQTASSSPAKTAANIQQPE